MTLREKIADWISGGALTRARANARLWMEAFNDERDEHDQTRRLEVARRWGLHGTVRPSEREFRLSVALCQIRDCETPYANATVRRMARMATEALK